MMMTVKELTFEVDWLDPPGFRKSLFCFEHTFWCCTISPRQDWTWWHLRYTFKNSVKVV